MSTVIPAVWAVYVKDCAEAVITRPARLGVHRDGRGGLLRYDRTAD